jgi:predicted DNA binding CopG/RHH family protein
MRVMARFAFPLFGRPENLIDSYAVHIYTQHMKRISIMLSIPQLSALRARAQTLGLSFSEFVRRVLDEYLRNNPA